MLHSAAGHQEAVRLIKFQQQHVTIKSECVPYQCFNVQPRYVSKVHIYESELLLPKQHTEQN